MVPRYTDPTDPCPHPIWLPRAAAIKGGSGRAQVAERCAAQHLADHFSATFDLVRA